MACQHCISNADDVIARIEELESDEERTEEETAELATLQALAAEASDYAPDWKYGATLIRDPYFEEDTQEYIEDVHGIKTEDWPFTRINWAEVADDREQDYTSVSFDGVDYWIPMMTHKITYRDQLMDASSLLTIRCDAGAVCTCGWTGPYRLARPVSHQDAVTHLTVMGCTTHEMRLALL